MGLIAISSLMLLGGMYLMIAFAWWLLQIIANWRIFTKAGEAGWKSIIPIYGDYISYKIAWQPAYFWLTHIFLSAGNSGNRRKLNCLHACHTGKNHTCRHQHYVQH